MVCCRVCVIRGVEDVDLLASKSATLFVSAWFDWSNLSRYANMKSDLSVWLLAVSPVDVDGVCSADSALALMSANVLTIDPFKSVPFLCCFVAFFCAGVLFGFVMIFIFRYHI